VVLIGIDESADGVADVGVVPAVGAEKNDLHISNLPKPMKICYLVNKINRNLS
jgi:hypothetical protein